MADVWQAVDTMLRRRVAIKLLKASVADDPTVAERFRREARALARLSHPNIVPVYDCVEEGGQVALVMRLIEGKSLRDLLNAAPDPGEKSGTLSVHLTVHIGRSIAAALAKAHSENIVHRDIKPGNILVMEDGGVLLTDFGIAKPLKATEDDGTDLTSANIMMGTAKYLSPEQVQGRELDQRADIYSLGLVLYECLAGHVPFRGDNDQAIAIARLQRDPTPLGGIRPDVPTSVIKVIHRMMRRKPENRYASCAEVAEALDDAMRQVHDSITPVEGVSSRSGSARPTERMDPLMTARRTDERVNRGTDRGAGTSRQRDRADRAVRSRVEETPRGIPRSARSLPSGQRTKTGRSYLPIAVLLLAALVVGALLWNGLRDSPSTTVSVDGTNVEVGPVSVTGIRSFDPNGDDGVENEQMIPALTDNNPATTWSTVCYADKFFGSKGGVGIVVSLSGLGVGQLQANFANAPYSAEVFSFAGDQSPGSFDGWGTRVADAYGSVPGIATFDVRTPGTHLLLVLREVGPSAMCSNNNPYKGVLSSLSFTSGS